MAFKKIQLSEKTLKKIAEALFLAYTVEQAAYLGGISRQTLARIQKTEIWSRIEEKALEFERPFRQKVWHGSLGWQGAAWMLERKYPSQLARPEIQLQVNASSTTTNNTLIITAEQAESLRSRSNAIAAELTKLETPSARTARSASSVLESAPASVEEEKASAAGSEEEGHHSATRTPGQASGTPDPSLSENSKTGKVSNNSNPDPNLAGNCQPSDFSGNSKKSGRHMTVADGRKRRDEAGRRASKRAEAQKQG
jgi:hypothetical protein